MTTPAPPPQQPPPPPSGLDDPALAVAVAAVLTGAAGPAVTVAGTVAALRAQFALSAAAASALTAVLTDVTSHPPPLTGVIGAASEQTSRVNTARRAQYVLAAAKRVMGAARDARSKGDPVTAAVRAQLAREQRYFAAHQAAMWQRATAAGRIDLEAAVHGRLLGWYAIRSKTSTPECLQADGCNFYADAPPDIGLPGIVHVNCFPAGTEVASPAVRAVTTRWHAGELIELTTLCGHHLAVTPNHPVLTPQGWIAAGLLNEGGEVVSTRFAERLLLLVDPDNHQDPALIEDVLRTFSERSGVMPVSVPVAAEDFHGDGAAGEVAVVWADRMLMDDLMSSQAKPRRIKQFSGVGWRDAVTALSGSAETLPGVAAAADGIMRRAGVARVLLRGAGAHHEPVSVGLAAARDLVAFQDPPDDRAADGVLIREVVLAGTAHVGGADGVLGEVERSQEGTVAALPGEVVGGPLVSESAAFDQRVPQPLMGDAQILRDPVISEIGGLVEFDRLVKVRRRAWSGHVFNLESSSGWLVSNNILTHNCRCFPGPPHPGGRLLPPAAGYRRAA